MTANRFWVRYLARWAARFDGISRMVNMGFLGLTGFSTASLMLKQYGYGEYAMPMGIILFFGAMIAAYLYAEGGVWNQVNRDKRDLSLNHSTPHMKISNEMTARGFFAGMKGRELTENERKAIRSEIDGAYQELRDGIEVDSE